MSTTATINVSSADSSLLSITEGKKNARGGIAAGFKYDNQNFQLRMPRMAFPGGLLQREDENSGNVSYKLIGSLKGCDPFGQQRATGDDDMSKLYNFLLDVKEKLIQTAVENSAKWFGKKRGEESIRDSFNDRSILSLSSDKVGDSYVPNGKYPPSFTMKIPVWDGRVTMDIVDNMKKQVHLTPDSLKSVFPKGIEANLIVDGSIYVIGQSFGVSWRIKNGQIFQKTRVTSADLFEAVPDEIPAVAEEVQEVEIPVQQEDETPAPVVAPKGRRKAAAQ